MTYHILQLYKEYGTMILVITVSALNQKSFQTRKPGLARLEFLNPPSKLGRISYRSSIFLCSSGGAGGGMEGLEAAGAAGAGAGGWSPSSPSSLSWRGWRGWRGWRAGGLLEVGPSSRSRPSNPSPSNL